MENKLSRSTFQTYYYYNESHPLYPAAASSVINLTSYF